MNITTCNLQGRNRIVTQEQLKKYSIYKVDMLTTVRLKKPYLKKSKLLFIKHDSNDSQVK